MSAWTFKGGFCNCNKYEIFMCWPIYFSLTLQEVEVAGVKFWCYTAGHVLGAAMFMIEIAGVKVLSVVKNIFLLT